MGLETISDFDVLKILEEEHDWMNVEEISDCFNCDKSLKTNIQQKVRVRLSQLTKFDFVIRKKNDQVKWGNEYIYKANGRHTK